MSKIRPYLFWVVCGIVLLIELGFLLFVSPSSKNGSPSEVKQHLDEQNKILDKLHVQAMAGSPGMRAFNPLNAADISDLETKWLATKNWKGVLSDLLTQYQAQEDDILAYLGQRSQVLHKNISSLSDPFGWYDAYQQATAELLKQLYEQKCIVVPNPTAQPGAMGMPPAGMMPSGMANQLAGQAAAGAPAPGAAPGGTAVADSGSSEPKFGTDQGLRGVLGFLTTTSYPEADQHDLLTTKFRVMEMIGNVLLNTKATNDTSPILKSRPPTEAHAKLQSTSWKDTSDDVLALQITLQGPLSAVLAVEAVLEENKGGEDEPLRVVLGATLTRKDFIAGERLGKNAEPVILTLDLAVLDFTSMAKQHISVVPVDTHAASGTPRPAPRPPPSGGSDDDSSTKGN